MGQIIRNFYENQYNAYRDAGRRKEYGRYDHVIATGGSAVYSEQAMDHLRSISIVVFIEISFGQVLKRVQNFSTRGIAKAEDQTLQDLYLERQRLYRKYAQITVNGDAASQEMLAVEIAARFGR
ncbi:MAG: shikimate kinase [Acidobacteriota bacterium]